jgi:hypothetical protein
VPRIRTLKPEIVEDEKTSRLSDTAFRLFVSMISLADDYGHVQADARWLQSRIWWAHATPPDVINALLELRQAGLVDVYGVRGGTYAALLGWRKHQRVDNAGKGKVPSPDDDDSSDVDEMLRPIRKRKSRRNSASRGEPPLDQEGDQEGEGEGESPRDAASSPPAFSPREGERRLASKLGLDPDVEAEKFRDYYASKGVRLADEHAGFRGWLRKAKKFDPSDGEHREIPDL